MRYGRKSAAWKRQGISKAAWLSAFERRMIEAKPELAGKIDWDTATHLYNQGLTPERAVARALHEPDPVDMAYEDQCRDICGL